MEHGSDRRAQNPELVAGPSSSNNMISRMALNDNKAGMEGLDKERINQIIFEASKDSKFFENEKKKEEQLELRIQEQQSKILKITQAQLRGAEREADKVLTLLENERNLSHTIVHVDMDAFYAAVEMRDDPSLQNKPMAVGGLGMLSTSNYLARRFGVRAAMPGFIGLKLCPDLVLVQPNFDKYTAVSKEIRQVLAQYDPNFCPMSLDEAYLDFTDHLKNRCESLPLSRMFVLQEKNTECDKTYGNKDVCLCDLNSVLRPALLCSSEFRDHGASDETLQAFLNSESSFRGFDVCSECNKIFPRYTCKVFGCSVEDAVLELRNRIEEKTHLTASAGIAPNTMLAKVCSDKNKPNGQYRIKPDKAEIMSFVLDLPIRKISGIGKVTEKLLGSIGVVTCRDLFTHRAMIFHLFSSTSFHHFMRISAGIGSTCVERDGERKSISTERTFSEISDPKLLLQKCRELCKNLSEDMKDEKTLGKTVTLKIKTVEFEVRTRSFTLPDFTNDEATLLKAAQMLLQTEITSELPRPLRLRLMGVRMSKLCSDQDSQVSVAEMFKKMDKKYQGDQILKAHPNPDFLSVQNTQSVLPKYHNICTDSDNDLCAEHCDNCDDNDEDESSIFSLPLDQTLSSEFVDHSCNKFEQESFDLNGRQKDSSSSGEVGILKFACKGSRASDGKVHVRRKGLANFLEKSQSETSETLNCEESHFGLQEN
ncbi:hypothetical protein EGW08_015654, partial [Elysia chlorotica]